MSDTLLFSTDNNNQKSFINETVTVSVPVYSGTLYTYTFNHGLGYIPSARVWYSPIAGRIYPLSTSQLGDNGSDFLEVTGDYHLTINDLVVNLFNAGAGTQDVTLRCRIYLDD